MPPFDSVISASVTARSKNPLFPPLRIPQTRIKAIGGGGLKIFSCFNILSSPGFVEPGTFYRIEKFCPSVKI